MELLAYWKIVRRRLWLIILIMLLGGIGAGYYSLQQPIQYEATTTLFLNSAVAKSVLGSLNRESVQSLANTYTEFMHTSSFAHRVATELGVPLSEKEVEKALSAKYVPDTQFFRITAVHTDTRLAQSLANTAAQVLIAENTVRQQTEQQQIAAQQAHSGPESQQRMVELRKALEDELVSYNDQIQGLQAQIRVLRQDAADEQSEQRLQQLRDALISLQSSRVNVLNSLVRAQSDIESNPTNIAPNTDTAVVVDAAPLPIVPLSRRTIEYTLLAFIVSLVLGLGLAFLLEYLDYTIKSPDTLESVYGDPALGVVRALPRKWLGERRQVQLITVSDPYSPSAEAFRVMRIGIQSARLDAPVHSLLITSAMPHEGKTFVATNLAVSLAQNGSRVVLVDADWRKPGLHDIFCLAREPGFTNLLFGRREDLATLLQHTGVENLRVLTCGTISPRPAELLDSQRVVQVMEQLIESADVVIYDSPPALIVTDALVLAPRVDAVLQVVLAGNTRIDLVLRCKAVLERAGARILGPVLNRVNQRDFGEYAPGYGDYYRTSKPVASRVLDWLMPRHKQQAEPTELLAGLENLTEGPQAEAVLAQGEVDGQDFLRANGRGRRIQ